jgi:glycosyltransferase involved in cell wall biosynthesis
VDPVAGRLRLGGIGSLARWKGWRTVIEAMALLPPESRGRVSFTHIGDGEADCLRELQRSAAQCGLAAQVVFRGRESSSDRLLGEIDALVVASENEPFSIAMLEALAAGVPVLAADSGGARDIIIEGVNGHLHPTGDAAALAAQLHQWLIRPPTWEVKKIRATAIDIDRTAAQWVQVYAAL